MLVVSCNEKPKGIHTKKKNDFAEKGEALFNQGDSTKTSTALNNEKKIANTADKKPKRTAPEPTVPSYDWVESVNKKNNLYMQAQKDLYLAATKLCETFDYQETFGYERSGYGNSQRKNGDTKIVINSPCSAFFPPPYIAPIEYYYHLFYNYKTIEEYKRNSFKLKEVRAQFNNKYQVEFNQLLERIDTKNVVSYGIAHGSIQEYDFETKRLRIHFNVKKNMNIRNYSGGTIAEVRPISEQKWGGHNHYIPMSEQEAKSIYEYYEKRGSGGTPFTLFCKTFYELRIPEVQKRRNRFRYEAIVKKIEFYKEFDELPTPSHKIGTLTF